MTETQELIARLRGIYRIPITDGLGAVGGGEEPDNPNEFVRHFETSPIQREAASALEHLVAERDAAVAAEREACAQIAERLIFDDHALAQATEYGRGSHETAIEITSSIRARNAGSGEQL